jgi:hypothetical protein
MTFYRPPATLSTAVEKVNRKFKEDCLASR